jgi:quinol monooxygenase YgiN
VHAAVRKYKVDPDQIDELSRRIASDFVPQVSQEPGFAAYHVINAGNGIVITVTLGDDGEAVERSMDTAATFVQDKLSDIGVERVEAAHGDVTVSETG